MSNFPSLKHDTLNATLIPLERDSHYQFRGIKYASVPARFEHSIPIDDWNGLVMDCRNFGPRCPQISRDLRQYFSIPPQQDLPEEVCEDEFECLNLVVSVPNDILRNPASKVPVMIFLHGGGHAATLVNIEQGFTDPTDIIKTSLHLGKPFVMVHFAYRLNVFGYAVYEGKTNFGFHDQKRAIEWVGKHVSGFGGDPGNITVVGESAGAIAVHAHIHGPSPTKGIKRAILQSGSLYLTPPAPQAVGKVVMWKLASFLGSSNLQTIPVKEILTGIEKLGLRNWWLHEEETIFASGPEGKVWPVSEPSELEAIMIGDCLEESRGFEPRIMSLGLRKLEEIFSQYSPVGEEIIQLYNIDFSSIEVARPQISAFINDLKFAFCTDEMLLMENAAGRRSCYRYLVDQSNPWDKSAGAHHAIDLVFLFGEPLNFSRDEQATYVGAVMREKWVKFLWGENPWDPGKAFAFGPAGFTGTVSDEDLAKRRRISSINGLRRIGWARCQALATRLMGARGLVDEAYE